MDPRCSSSHGAPQIHPRYHQQTQSCRDRDMNGSSCEKTCPQKFGAAKPPCQAVCECSKQMEPQLAELQKKLDAITRLLQERQEKEQQQCKKGGCCS
jgi:hypothetical protein